MWAIQTYGGIQTEGASKHMGMFKHMGCPNIQGISKHRHGVSKHIGGIQTYGRCPAYTYRGHPNIWGCPNILEYPNIWGYPNIQGASKHRGHQNIQGVSKNMGASKHTGGIRTYRGHPAKQVLPLVLIYRQMLGHVKW